MPSDPYLRVLQESGAPDVLRARRAYLFERERWRLALDGIGDLKNPPVTLDSKPPW
jgi:hypothetical protein